MSDKQEWGGDHPFKMIHSETFSQDDVKAEISAMEIPNVGCVVSSLTRVRGGVSETMVFVPGVRIEETREDRKVIGRKLVDMTK